MSHYDLRLTDSHGRVLLDRHGRQVLSRAASFSASRTANRIAQFSMVLPPDVDPSLVRDDNMVQVWRQPDGGALGLWRVYFIRKRHWKTQGGDETLTISGPDCNDILRRRVVAARPNNSQVDKVQPIDNMMKEIVLEAFADGANPSPAFGTRANDRLSIAADTSQGPIVQISFPWAKLLTYGGSGLFPKLTEIARAEEVPIYFDVVPDKVTAEEITFRFNTYAYYPGSDLTDRVTFSLAQGNMENPEYIEDATRAEDYIYVFGQGEGSDQKVEQVYDTDRVRKSAWGRVEGVQDATSQPDDAVADAGRSALTSRRPKRSFFADPVSTRDTTFGVDWNWGDKVRAQYHGRFDAVVESITLRVEGGDEHIEGRLRSEE